MSLNRTPIEWVKNPNGTQGYTWNPITGCLNGCEYCYARKLANGRLRERYLANENIPERSRSMDDRLKLEDPFYPRFWEDRLFDPVNKIRRWGRQSKVVHRQEPKGIFVCDMSDLFGIGIPEEWTQRVIDRFQYAPQHRFYLLTKQPQNLIKFSPFPENCFIGATITDDEMMKPTQEAFDDIVARWKFISFEPLLGRLSKWSLKQLRDFICQWVIIGAQTKPYKPPKCEWVSEIIDACVKADIPYFLKNNLELVVPRVFGGDGSLIQEMPR